MVAVGDGVAVLVSDCDVVDAGSEVFLCWQAIRETPIIRTVIMHVTVIVIFFFIFSPDFK